MSHQETHIGVLRKIDLKGKTIEQWIKEYALENGDTHLPHHYDDWIQYINDKLYKTHIITKTDVWERKSICESSDYPYFCKIIPQEDGTYIYATSFYNGGTCLSEMLEEGLNELKK